MTFIKGDLRVLYIKDDDGEYKPVGCLTSNPLSEGTDMLRTTTAASGGWRTSIPTTQFFSIQFEGLQVLSGPDYDPDLISYDSLKLKKRAKELLYWRIRSGNLIDDGRGYITDLSEGNSVGEFLEFSGQIEGYGVPVFSRALGAVWQDGNAAVFQNGNRMIY